MRMGPAGRLRRTSTAASGRAGALSLRWELTDNIAVTPRVIYQDININGYNRQDIWNILANPFTTTEPAVIIGEREQYASSTSTSTTISFSAT